MSNKTCYFCRSTLTGNRSKEHVFPQWLLNHFGIRGTMISPTHFSTTGDVRSTRIHDLNKLLAGRVCSNCNNGWMSQLESDAKEHVVSLADVEKEVIDLLPIERFVLARWAVKTAFMLNLASNYHKQIPSEHCMWLYEKNDTLPSQVVVFAQQHHGKEPYYWIQSPSWFVHDEQGIMQESIAKELQTKSYKIALLFRRLLLLVAYQPFSQLRYVVWQGIHIPLYPSRGSVAFYKNKEFEWYDSINSISQFHGGLGLLAFNG